MLEPKMAVTTNFYFLLFGNKMSLLILLLLCFTTGFGLVENGNIPGIDIGKVEEIPPKLKESPQKLPQMKSSTSDKGYHQMKAGIDSHVVSNGKRVLHIFCYQGEAKNLVTLFKTVQMNLSIKNDDFMHFEGSNASEIKRDHKERSWFTFYPWRLKTFNVDLYKPSCVGIETSQDFTIGLRIRWLDFWRLVVMGGSVILFFAAPLLAKDVFFHYTTGIAIGILGALIITVMYLRKFIPWKTGGFAVMVGGWGLFIYSVHYVWENFKELIKEYQAVAIGYIIVAGLLSFVVVYRCGPVTDQRSISLVQWALQLASLLAIFFSSQYREATLGLDVVILSYHNIPNKWKAKVRTYWRRRFPPKIKRLSEEEYIQQGTVETQKALEELREYCRSPNCNAWKTVSRLKTPTRYVEFVGNRSKRQSFTPKCTQRKRFAEFIEGGSHLDDDAILAYESNHVTPVRDEDDLYPTTDDED